MKFMTFESGMQKANQIKQGSRSGMKANIRLRLVKRREKKGEVFVVKSTDVGLISICDF